MYTRRRSSDDGAPRVPHVKGSDLLPVSACRRERAAGEVGAFLKRYIRKDPFLHPAHLRNVVLNRLTFPSNLANRWSSLDCQLPLGNVQRRRASPLNAGWVTRS